jgi:hypothetical protein
MMRAIHLGGSLLVLLLGLALWGLDSLAHLLVPGAIALVGVLWLAYAILYAVPALGALHRRRAEATLALGSTLLAALVALVLAAVVSPGPTANMVRAHFDRSGGPGQPPSMRDSTSDAEIGWAPSAPDDYVGQRLQKIDGTRPHVVMVGDSILYGLDLPDAETASELMNARRHDVQFLNLSVSGWSIEQYWLYLRRVIPHTKPKLIVVGLFTGNDVQLTSREFTPWGHGKPLYHVENGELAVANHATGCADRMSKSLLFRWLWSDKDRAERLVRSVCKPRELPVGETEVAVARMFDEIERIGRDHGVRVLWLLLPSRNDLNVWSTDRTLYIGKYSLLKRLLREGKHETLEFLPELLRQHAELDKLFKSDNAHLTAAGHRVLADYLLKYIDDHHLL